MKVMGLCALDPAHPTYMWDVSCGTLDPRLSVLHVLATWVFPNDVCAHPYPQGHPALSSDGLGEPGWSRALLQHRDSTRVGSPPPKPGGPQRELPPGELSCHTARGWQGRSRSRGAVGRAFKCLESREVIVLRPLCLLDLEHFLLKGI